jgi:DNA-directed RNA polymerase subunit RPC12/RpoP
MDVIFNCPKCDQELAVDSSGAGSEIDCPSCGESIVIPGPDSGSPPLMRADSPVGGSINPIAASAAAKVQKHLRVPVHKTTEVLIEKPLAPLDAATKDTDKKIRVKTIRHTDCIEVGHDKFDEVISNFLSKIGEANVVSLSPMTYSYVDIGTQKLLTDFAVMIVYRG